MVVLARYQNTVTILAHRTQLSNVPSASGSCFFVDISFIKTKRTFQTRCLRTFPRSIKNKIHMPGWRFYLCPKFAGTGTDALSSSCRCANDPTLTSGAPSSAGI